MQSYSRCILKRSLQHPSHSCAAKQLMRSRWAVSLTVSSVFTSARPDVPHHAPVNMGWQRLTRSRIATRILLHLQDYGHNVPQSRQEIGFPPSWLFCVTRREPRAREAWPSSTFPSFPLSLTLSLSLCAPGSCHPQPNRRVICNGCSPISPWQGKKRACVTLTDSPFADTFQLALSLVPCSSTVTLCYKADCHPARPWWTAFICKIDSCPWKQEMETKNNKSNEMTFVNFFWVVFVCKNRCEMAKWQVCADIALVLPNERCVLHVAVCIWTFLMLGTKFSLQSSPSEPAISLSLSVQK